MGQQKCVSNIHVSVGCIALVLRWQLALVDYPGHNVRIIRAPMLVEHVEHPVKVIFGLAVITSHESEDDHPVTVYFRCRYLGACTSRSPVKDVISSGWSNTIRFPNVFPFPVFIISLEGVIN